MPFIKSTHNSEGKPAIHADKPSMPALQAILYWIATLTLFCTIFLWLDGLEPLPIRIKIIGTATAITIALLLYGLGQVIGYLGQTAYYARRLFEISQTSDQSRDA